MPQKRKTRATKGKSRPKAKVPDGDEGQNLAEEERTAKVEVLISDFCDQVQARVARMHEMKQRIMEHFDRITRMEISKLPKDVRSCKVTDFIAMGGEIDYDKIVETDKDVQDLAKDLMQKVDSATQKSRNVLQTISEEGSGSKHKTSQDRKGVLMEQSMNKQAQSVSKAGALLEYYNSRSTRTRNPGHRLGGPPSVMDTPMVTPIFDRRLPKTPGLQRGRKQKPGERVHTMIVSERGSPITDTSNTRGTLVSVGPNMIDLDNINMDEGVALDAPTLDSLQQIQDKISSIIKMGNVK